MGTTTLRGQIASILLAAVAAAEGKPLTRGDLDAEDRQQLDALTGQLAGLFATELERLANQLPPQEGYFPSVRIQQGPAQEFLLGAAAGYRGAS